MNALMMWTDVPKYAQMKLAVTLALVDLAIS